jgi:hypothetical protein
MASRYYSAVAQDTTLTSTITSSSTSITVGSTTGYPTSYPFIVALDYNTSTEELVSIVGASGLTFTIGTTVGVANVSGRGYNGTSATAHNAGAVVRHVITAQDLTDAQTHYGTTLSSGAHGVTGALATFFGSTTSANLAAVVTDETGSGGLVFANTPTLVTPVLGAATATSVNGTTIPSSATLVTTTGTQTLTNKDLTSSTNSFPSNLGNTFTVNAQTGTAYTLVVGDANKLVTATNALAITITIPSGVFSVGQSINIVQLGVGQVTFQGDGTSVVYSTPGVKLRAQYSIANVACIATNTFLLVGDLTA